jgi:hypothetical protein
MTASNNETRNEMKTFHLRQNIGKARYVVKFHDGEKTHADGSPFFDMHIFTNKKDLKKFTDGLKKDGYTES